MSKPAYKVISNGINNATNDTLLSEFSECESLNQRKKPMEDCTRKLDHDSSKKLPAERDSDILQRSAQDKKCDSDKKIHTENDLNDSDFFSKRKLKKDAEHSLKKLPADKENEIKRESSIKRPELERKVSEIRRQNSISGAPRKGPITFDAANESGSTLDAEGKKGTVSELFRRATTKDLANLSGSELPGRRNSITRRNSVSSDEDFRKQQPVLTRINSKLNGLLKTMRWVEENDGSRARKLVKTMADFGKRYTVYFLQLIVDDQDNWSWNTRQNIQRRI
jgi:hypothetical protein